MDEKKDDDEDYGIQRRIGAKREVGVVFHLKFLAGRKATVLKLHKSDNPFWKSKSRPRLGNLDPQN